MATKKTKTVSLAETVRLLRQSAIIASSAADHLDRVVRAQNPDRFLRRWTAEQTVANQAKQAKETKGAK